MKHGTYGKKLRNIFIAIACCFVFIFSVLITWTLVEMQRANYKNTLQHTIAAKSDSIRVTVSTILSALRSLQQSEASSQWAESTTQAQYYAAATKLYQQTSRAITNISLINYDIFITQNNEESIVIHHTGTLPKALFLSSESSLTEKDWEVASAHFKKSNDAFFIPTYKDGALEYLYYIEKQQTQKEALLYFVEIPAQTLCGNDSAQQYIIYNEESVIATSSENVGIQKELADELAFLQAQKASALSPYEQFSHNGIEVFLIRTMQLPLTIAFQYRFSVFSTPQIVLVLLLAILIFAALSFIVFLWLSNSLYRPFRETLTNAVDEASSEEPFDEFKIIRQNVSTIDTLNTQLQTAIQENSAIMKRRYYRELLFGIPDSDCPLSAEQMSACYCVAIIELQASPSNEDSNDWFFHLQKNYLYVHVQNLLAKYNIYCFSEGYNTCAVILQVDSQQEATAVFSQFFTLPELKLELKIALSDIRESVIHICDCYQQALHILEYRYKIPSRTVITAAILQQASTSAYYYPLVLESRIIQAIALGKPSCLELYDSIIRENKENPALSSIAQQNLVFALIGTLMRVFQELKTTPQELLGYDIDFHSLHAEHDITQISKKLREYIQSIIIAVQSRQNNHDDELLRSMLDFITSNYSDDIMLIDIAEYCKVSPTYCSTLFKRLSNDNFKTFLNRYRIDRACEFIQKNPRIKINDLSAAVGFNSANSFIRVFSKVTGMTPKVYADKLISEST